jgi:hypothetical protein
MATSQPSQATVIAAPVASQQPQPIQFQQQQPFAAAAYGYGAPAAYAQPLYSVPYGKTVSLRQTAARYRPFAFV